MTDERLTRGIDHDDPARFGEDLAAALIAFLPRATEILHAAWPRRGRARSNRGQRRGGRRRGRKRRGHRGWRTARERCACRRLPDCGRSRARCCRSRGVRLRASLWRCAWRNLRLRRDRWGSLWSGTCRRRCRRRCRSAGRGLRCCRRSFPLSLSLALLRLRRWRWRAFLLRLYGRPSGRRSRRFRRRRGWRCSGGSRRCGMRRCCRRRRRSWWRRGSRWRCRYRRRRGRAMWRGGCRRRRMWRCSSRRCRATGRRSSLRRCSLRRLLGFSVGTKLFLGLCHNQWRGLRVRRRACKLHRRQSGGGKQQQTKSCHDGLGPRKSLGRKVFLGRKVVAGRSWQEGLGNKACHQGLTINEQALGGIVAGFKGGFIFISDNTKPHCGFVHYAFRGSFKSVCSYRTCGISALPESGRSSELAYQHRTYQILHISRR